MTDDVVEIRKINEHTLMGTSPEITRHFIELRGIGIIDVKTLYGVECVKEKQQIDLVIKLEDWDKDKPRTPSQTRKTNTSCVIQIQMRSIHCTFVSYKVPSVAVNSSVKQNHVMNPYPRVAPIIFHGFLLLNPGI